MIVALIFLAGLLMGIVGGWAIALAQYHNERKAMAADWLDLAHQLEEHAKRLQLDDMRVGINEGVAFAIAEMDRTLDELRSHLETKSTPQEQPNGR